jgi:inositol oxygenase
MSTAELLKPVVTGPLKDLDEIDDLKKEEALAAKVSKKKRRRDDSDEDKNFNPVDKNKRKEAFRNFHDSARQKRVQKFYELQHSLQTFDFVQSMEQKYLTKLYAKDKSTQSGVWMGIWEAIEYLDSVVDDSDPDTNLTQIQHALQTAEAIRQKWPQEEKDWFPLVGLIHDLGKIIAVKDEKKGLLGEPQWCVVGDSFPVGVPFSEKNVFANLFASNPDFKDPKYNTGTGIYQEGCGLFNVHMSWGHDEYLYHVCVANGSKLPLAGLYMIRYHSFYPWHKEGAYEKLLDKQDRDNLEMVKEFNQFDLYSKAHDVCDVDKLKPYYEKLIAKYFPEKVLWM